MMEIADLTHVAVISVIDSIRVSSFRMHAASTEALSTSISTLFPVSTNERADPNAVDIVSPTGTLRILSRDF